MDPQEVCDKHIAIFKAQRREGIGVKFIILILWSIASVFSYFEMKARYINGEFGKEISEENIIPIVIAIALFFGLLLLISKSVLFVSPKKLKSTKNDFKKDVFHLLKDSNPEITDYLPRRKISSKEFYSSNLFHTQFEDYIGEEWIEATFKESKIIICELRVSRLFKKIFKGVFVKCSNISKPIPGQIRFDHLTIDEPINQIIFSGETQRLINDYCSSTESKISISTLGNKLFIAFESNKNLFERSDLICIRNLPEDISTFNSIFKIIKCIVRDLK